VGCGQCTKERDRRKKVREVVDDVMGKGNRHRGQGGIKVTRGKGSVRKSEL